VHGYPAMGILLTTMRASLISDDGEAGIYIAHSLLDGSSAKCMIGYNDTLCAEERGRRCDRNRRSESGKQNS
jgi:hypothetical protein